MHYYRVTLFAVLLSSSLSSCMSFNDRDLRPVRNSITDQFPGLELKKEFAVSLGSSLFNLVDILTVSAGDISELDEVDVAVYAITSVPSDFARFSDDSVERAVRKMNSRLEWDTIVRVNEDREQVWILVGLDVNSIAAITVVSLEEDELVLVNVRGDLEELLDYAMAPARGHPGVVNSG